MLFGLFDSDSSGVIRPEAFAKLVASSRKKKETSDDPSPDFPNLEETSRISKMKNGADKSDCEWRCHENPLENP